LVFFGFGSWFLFGFSRSGFRDFLLVFRDLDFSTGQVLGVDSFGSSGFQNFFGFSGFGSVLQDFGISLVFQDFRILLVFLRTWFLRFFRIWFSALRFTTR